MIVVDCAAIVDAISGLQGNEPLRGRLAIEDMHAPALLDFEVVSALRGMTLRREISETRARDALLDFDDLPIERWSASAPMRQRAFILRNNVSAYDAAYVALSEALECPLVTSDARLARSTGHEARIEVL